MRDDVVARYSLTFKDLASKGLTRVAATSRLAAKGLRVAATAMAALGAGAVFAGAKLVNAFSERADEIAKFTKETGFAAQAMQNLEFMSARQGAQFETVKKGIQAFNKGLGELRGGYGTLDTSLRRLNPALADQLKTAESSQDAYFLMLREIAKLPDAADKAALAAAAFGQRGAKAILRITADGVGALDALEKRAKFLRPPISDASLKSAEAYEDALTDVKTALGGVSDSIGSSLLPRLTPLMVQLADFIAINRELIASKTAKFFDQLADGAKGVDFKQLAADGLEIVRALAEILPMIAGVARGFSKLVGGPGNAVKILFGATIAKNILMFGGGMMKLAPILGKIGGLFKVFGGLAMGLVRAVVSIGPVFTTLVAIGKGGLLPLLSRIPFLFGPIGIAIGLVITAGVLLYKNWDVVKAKALELWANMKTVWAAIVAVFNGAIAAIGQVVSNGAGMISSAWSGAMNTMSAIASSVWGSIKNVVANGVNFYIDQINWLIRKYNSFANSGIGKSIGLGTAGEIGRVGQAAQSASRGAARNAGNKSASLSGEIRVRADPGSSISNVSGGSRYNGKTATFGYG